MREGYWVTRTYRSGQVGEKIKYFVVGEKPDRLRRETRRELSRTEKKNRGQALRVLARLINANFTKGDILLGLDYDDKGMDKLRRSCRRWMKDGMDERDAIQAAARHELTLCLRRAKRAMKKAGIELRYIAVTSDMDGDSGEPVRIHHHLILGREAWGYVAEAWTNGNSADYEYLRGQKDYTPMAEYLLRQVRGTKDEKKYVSSRNLVRPAPRDRMAQSGAVVRAPAGTWVVELKAGGPFEPQYIRYVFTDPSPGPG